MSARHLHVLSSEFHYRDGLRDGPAAGIFEAVNDAGIRARNDSSSPSSAAGRRPRPRVPPHAPGVATPETWTVRKVLRRLFSHERAHTFEILERRGWAAFGAPRR